MIGESKVFPLFKACTRPPMVLGVPTRALVVVVGFIMLLCVTFSFWLLALIPITIFIMGQVTKKDDKQFNLIAVWFKTKALYPAKLRKMWNATTYSPQSDSLQKLDDIK